MRCHYVLDPKIGKVLIPECHQVIMSNDIRDCTCPRGYRDFEKEEYNVLIRKMSAEIEYWKGESDRLNKIIESTINTP